MDRALETREPTRAAWNGSFLMALMEGNRAGLISSKDVVDAQSAIMALTRQIALDRNVVESSSIPVETAQSLMQSILYCLDAWCVRFVSMEDCLNEIQSGPLSACYQEGLTWVFTHIQDARQLFEEVKQNRLDIPLTAYRDTVHDSFPAFFAAYDPIFHASDIPASIDYPLSCGEIPLTGIRYIHRYLSVISMENRFCRLFGQDSVARLLENYSRACHVNAKEYLLNLFELTCDQALLSGMLGKDARELSISPWAYDQLIKSLLGLEASAITRKVSKAANQLLDGLGITEPELTAAVQARIQVLSSRLVLALETGGLEKVIITDQAVPEAPAVTLFQTASMEDSAFRAWVRRVSACDNPAEAVRLVLAFAHSLRDFVDLLKADCLSAETYPLLFASVGGMELAVLTRIALPEAGWEVTDLTKLPESTESGAVWEQELLRALRQPDKARKAGVEQWLNTPMQGSFGIE